MARRRRRTLIDEIVDAITRSQIAALCFAVVGLILVSPLPEALLRSVRIGEMTANPYSAMMGGAYLSAAVTLLPIVRIMGFLLIALAMGSLIFNSRKPGFLAALKTPSANAGAVAAIAVATVGLWLVHPRHTSAMGDRTIETAGDPASTAQPRADGAFPANGTIRWGDAGQPIGGNLERLEIWDVTQSPEHKVVAIRNGLVPDYPGVRTVPYATVYVHPGQRVSLMLPAGLAYHVTAMAGSTWEGDETMFGRSGTTVDFGRTMLMAGQPQIITMGAPDQTASIVPNDRF